MIKVVDIEYMKNKYLHRVGTQFDNAISVAEKEFLIDAYTKADIEAILKELQEEIEDVVKEEEPIDKKWAIGLHHSKKIIQQKIDSLKKANFDMSDHDKESGE